MKTKLIPILGLAAVASTIPLTVSCNKSNPEEPEYEKTMDLSEVIKGYERTTDYHTGQLPEEISNHYRAAIKDNHNIFIDDIFETISDSTFWSYGSTLEGKLSLALDDAKIIEMNAFASNAITAKSHLDHVILVLSKPRTEALIKELSFNGTINVENLPFIVYCDTDDDNKYKLKIDTGCLSYKLWTISINGHAAMKTEENEIYEEDIKTTFNYKNYEKLPILEKLFLDILLGYVKYDLPYFNKQN